MASVLPFRGLTYSTSLVPDLELVVTPPYDVISAERDEEYRHRHPHNIVHVILPRPGEGRDKYASAAALLVDWQKDGILVRDESPCLYVVSQRYTVKGLGERTRFGVIARVRIEDEEAKGILPHERTMDAPRQDRMDLLAATMTNLSQVFLLHSDPGGEISRLIEAAASMPPDRWAADDAGIEASLWRISAPGTIESIRMALSGQTLWIADGHHRYAAARELRDCLRSKDGSAPGTRGYDYVMAMLTSMDSPGVTILPYHRSVRTAEPMDTSAFTAKAQEYFDLKEFAFEGFEPRAEQIRRRLLEGSRAGRQVFAAYTGQGSFLLLFLRDSLDRERLLGGALEGPLKELDVSVLHHVLLGKALGIDPEDQRREGGPLRYTDDIDRALSWVDAQEAQVAILLNPTRKEQLIAVSEADLQMPQKSTYFYPKALTGLVLNPLDPSEEVQPAASPATRAG